MNHRAFGIVIVTVAVLIFAFSALVFATFLWAMVTDPTALARGVGRMFKAFQEAADLR